MPTYGVCKGKAQQCPTAATDTHHLCLNQSLIPEITLRIVKDQSEAHCNQCAACEALSPGMVELHSTPPAVRPAKEDDCTSSIPGCRR
jgi:hypothetical protein